MSIFDNISKIPLPILNHWGYWIILFTSFIESSPIFGLVVPGQFLVVIAGFLAKKGVFDLGDVIWVSALGAIAGDLLGYFLGRKYGYRFILKYGKYVLFKKKHFEKTRILINKNPGKTLIIGRFNSLARSFAPFAAGATNLSFPVFFFYNIIGGITWAISFSLIGYIFGKSYEVASKYFGEFVLIAIITSILIIYLYHFINKRKHIFNKYNLYALMLNILSLYLFSKMIEDLLGREFITKLDKLVNAKMSLIWNPHLNQIMLFITKIGNAKTLIALSLILFCVLIYKKKIYNSLLLALSMAGGFLFEFLTKLIIHRARPENALMAASGYSFPSGHATISIIFFSVMIYSFKDYLKNVILKKSFIIANIIIFLLIGFSRIYLGVHWLSDVIAGFALGLFWLTFLVLLFKLIKSLAKTPANILKRKIKISKISK